MANIVRSFVLIPCILVSLSAFSQQTSACGVHPEDTDATIAACTAVIKQVRHQQAQCRDEMVWAASTRESLPLATTPSVPVTLSPECSGYLPPPPLYAHNIRPEHLTEAHRIPNATPGYEPSADLYLGQYLLYRADAYFAKGKFASAVSDYDAAAKFNETNETDPTLFYRRALAYHGLRNDSHAVDDFTAAIRLDASNAAAWAGRCRSRAILGKLPQALTDCDTSISLLVNNPAAYKARGLVNLKRKQCALAISDYGTAIQLSQPTAVSLYGRGLARRADGDLTGAAADISAALQLNPRVAIIFKRYHLHLK